MNWRAALAAFQRWFASHSQRDRRIIAGVGIAAAAALVLIAVVDPLRAYRRRVGEEIADGQERLERAARFAGAIDTLRAERAELRKRLQQANSRLLPGDSGTLGAAALQERANTLAAEKNVSVLSTQVMKSEPADPFEKVAVRLTLSGELKPFAELVSGLEYGPQQLTIPFVEVSRRGAVPGAKGPRILSATVEVSGYLRAGGAKDKEKEKGGEAPEGEGEANAPEAAAGGGEGASPPGEGAAPAGVAPPAASEGAPAQPPAAGGVPAQPGAPAPSAAAPAPGVPGPAATPPPAATAPPPPATPPLPAVSAPTPAPPVTAGASQPVPPMPQGARPAAPANAPVAGAKPGTPKLPPPARAPVSGREDE